MSKTLREPPKVGTVLDDTYQLEALIGRGGMGWVYRAVNIRLARVVALKVLAPSAKTSDKEAGERFAREAEMIGSLSHPNIVRIFDYGKTEDGRAFFAMELLKGESLKSLLHREAPLADAQIFEIIGQILDALTEAHRVGVIHRDLKPDNIFIQSTQRPGDRVKLLDFGVAQSFAPSLSLDQLEERSSGVIVGSPRFMAPEQARGLGVTPRTDLYQVGLILYQMLAGHQPFRANTLAELMIAHCTQAPAPIRRDGGLLTGPLISLVERLLSKNPRNRPESAEATSRLLESCQSAPYQAVLDLPSALPVGASLGSASVTGPVGMVKAIASDTQQSGSGTTQADSASHSWRSARNSSPSTRQEVRPVNLDAVAPARKAPCTRPSLNMRSLLASSAKADDLAHSPRQRRHAKATAVLAVTCASLIGLSVGLSLDGVSSDTRVSSEVIVDAVQSSPIAVAADPALPAEQLWTPAELTHLATGAVGSLPGVVSSGTAAAATNHQTSQAGSAMRALGSAVGNGVLQARAASTHHSVSVDTVPSGHKLFVGRRYLGRSPQVVTWSLAEQPPRVDARRLDDSWISVTLGADDHGSSKLLKLAKRGKR